MASSFLSSAAAYGDVSQMNPTNQVIDYQMDKLKWTQMGQAAGRAEALSQAQATGVLGGQQQNPQLNQGSFWGSTNYFFHVLSYVIIPLAFAGTVATFFMQMGIAAASLAAIAFFIFTLHAMLANSGYGAVNMYSSKLLVWATVGGIVCGSIVGGGGYAVLIEGHGGENKTVMLLSGGVVVFLVFAGLMAANSSYGSLGNPQQAMQAAMTK